MPSDKEDEHSEALVKTEAVSENHCQRCGKEYKKRLLLFNNRIKKDCISCGKTVCPECISKDERIDSTTNRRGLVCIDCYPKSRSVYANIGNSLSNSFALLPGVTGVMDINAAVDSIESKIPKHLDDISGKLDQITIVNDTLESLIKLIKYEVEDVKKFSESFTLKNWKIIRRDVYIIIFSAGVGIFILAGLIAVQIMLMFKYIYPLL